ncbi:MAG TPA: hypothetical protein VEZ14_12135 [Dehalococcoidia bacterium]|nr:hypothetical protein [Dehalococcoidia bacterium]
MKPAFLALIVAAAITSVAQVTYAKENPTPSATVTVSSLQAGSHPDMQIKIGVPSGPSFNELRVAAPPGLTIAADAAIPEGSAVGEMEAVGVTNGLILPACELHFALDATVRKVTADPAAPDYLAYLRQVAPGRHRLRLADDLTHMAGVPLVVNFIFDQRQAGDGGILARIFVGDPSKPPLPLKVCTPEAAWLTLRGVTPAGVPLLSTSSKPITGTKPFSVTIISRANDGSDLNRQTVLAPVRMAPVKSPPAASLLAQAFATTGTSGGTSPLGLPDSGTGPTDPPTHASAAILLLVAGTGMAMLGAGAWIRSRAPRASRLPISRPPLAPPRRPSPILHPTARTQRPRSRPCESKRCDPEQ